MSPNDIDQIMHETTLEQLKEACRLLSSMMQMLHVCIVAVLLN